MKTSLITCLLLCLAATGWAQTDKILYQTFAVSDTTQTIQLDIVGEVEYEPWPADRLMAETSVMLEGAPPRIMEFLIEQGRYALLGAGLETLKVESRDKERRKIEYKGTTCFEQVKVKIFIPKNFELDEGRNALIRTEE